MGHRRKPEGEQQVDTYEVYEETTELCDHRTRGPTSRRLIVRSASLGRKYANTRERHLLQAERELKALRGKLNTRTLNTRQALDVAIKKM